MAELKIALSSTQPKLDISMASAQTPLEIALASAAKGDAGTITIGTVTAGATGEQASVVNRGTASSAILDFVLPKGDPPAIVVATHDSPGVVIVGSSLDVTTAGTLNMVTLSNTDILNILSR